MILGLTNAPSQGGFDLAFLELKTDGSIVSAFAQGDSLDQNARFLSQREGRFFVSGASLFASNRGWDAFIGTFGDSLELCSHFFRQRITDLTITDYSGAPIINNPFPWGPYPFTVAPLSAISSDVSSIISSSQEEAVCPTNFDTWEAIEAKQLSNSCLSSLRGHCEDASSLTSV